MQIKTPNCPECGRAPYMVIDGGAQAFCGNVDSCPVISWNPQQSIEELRANVTEVDLGAADD